MKWINTFFSKKKSQPQKKKVCWDFLGKMLGEILLFTDDENDQLGDLDDQDPKVLIEIIREFVVPNYQYYLPEDQEKIRNSLAYYLTNNSKKLERIFPSFQIPIDDHVAQLFYNLVWKELYGTDFPDPIEPDEYEEDCSTKYINSLTQSYALIEKYNSTGKEPSLTNVIARLKQKP